MTKNDFYRYCRLIHGWLSAFAFIALCFFSFTGLLLNHPEWFSGSPASIVKTKFTLTETEAEQLRTSSDPSRMLAGLVAKKVALQGKISEDETEGNPVGNEIFV